MSDTIAATVGQKGRVVIPHVIRQRHEWGPGSTLIFIETETGVEVRERDQALRFVRASLKGPSLADELVRDRHHEAAMEGAVP